jgi:hypothetical protein
MTHGEELDSTPEEIPSNRQAPNPEQRKRIRLKSLNPTPVDIEGEGQPFWISRPSGRFPSLQAVQIQVIR